jgi:hypothetical protein
MDENFAYIGNRNVWGGAEPFGISPASRRQHLYAIGKTGTGKSTLLRNLIIQDIEAGRGVGLIDPHGDLAEEILECIPSWRTDHVLYFNPSDNEFPIGLNLVRSNVKERNFLHASGLVSAFKHFWRDSWGPRLEYILYATVAALLECENVSLLGVPRMLSDERYRAWAVKQVRDPMVRSFWENEFARYDKSFLAEVVSPIQNKVGQLLMAPPLRNIFGQVRSRFDCGFIMDNERIFIANLSKGKLGEDKANLLGSLLLTKFQLAAMERANIQENERKDFFLFVDEFHNFSTDSFASVLSEARKYRLCLTLSHQYIEQLLPEIRNAVFGNVGSIVSFRVGNIDADVLANEFGNDHKPEHFTDLGNHEVRVKLLEHGEYGEPFFARTAPPTSGFHRHGENLIRRSRERFGVERAVVESRIRRWLGK